MGTKYRVVPTRMKLRYLWFAPVMSLLLANTHVQADEGIGTFTHIAEPAPPTRPDQWGPVPTYLFSIVNVAPGLLPFFNNALVFGVPGTVVGNFWENTQLTGDWGGARTELARHGFFFDAYERVPERHRGRPEDRRLVRAEQSNFTQYRYRACGLVGRRPDPFYRAIPLRRCAGKHP